MLRQIAGFAPANVAPALVSFGIVYAFTRLLTPAEYGVYTLAANIAMFGQAVLFYSIAAGMARYYPAAARINDVATLMKCGYGMFAVVATCLVIVAAIVSIFHGQIIWLIFGLLLLRGAINLQQDVNRMADHRLRYNVIVGIDSGIGFASAILLTWLIPSANSILLGLGFGSLICVAIYAPSVWASLRHGSLERATLKRLWQFMLPFALTGLLSQSTTYIDRFVITGFIGTHELAIYAVAWALVIQPINLIGGAIATATLPLSVQQLEHHGEEAGRTQAMHNGMLIFALLLPTSAGLALCHMQIAYLLTGVEFRDMVAQLIPMVALIGLIRSISTFYFEHAFYLSRRLDLMFWAYLPASLGTIILNLVLVPSFGIYGALLSGAVCQIILMIALIIGGRQVFRLPFPLHTALRIAGATAFMVVVVHLIDAPVTWLGLIEQVVVGGTAYAIAMFACDGIGLRTWLMQAKMA